MKSKWSSGGEKESSIFVGEKKNLEPHHIKMLIQNGSKPEREDWNMKHLEESTGEYIYNLGMAKGSLSHRKQWL